MLVQTPQSEGRLSGSCFVSLASFRQLPFRGARPLSSFGFMAHSTTEQPAEGGAKQTSPLPYMPQLDSLRAFAVLLVLAHHWLPAELRLGMNTGRFGVRLFFVLSGFLITAILLYARRRGEQIDYPKQRVMGSFYARRFLRIFPLYYAVLGLTVVAGLLGYARAADIVATFPWHAAYLSNILYGIAGGTTHMATHFWSLAVEEQFYLVWPWVVVFIPRRFLLPSFIVLVIAGPLWRLFAIWQDFSIFAVRWQVVACLDSLGIGALLALLRFEHDVSEKVIGRLRLFSLAVGIPVFIAALAFDQVDAQLPTWPGWVVLGDLGGALVFVWLIDWAARGVGGVAGQVLSNPVLLYLGRISYGIYVLHIFAQYGLRDLLEAGGLNDLLPDPVRLVLYFGVTVALASLSWHVFESPINNFKRHFKYVDPEKLERSKMHQVG